MPRFIAPSSLPVSAVIDELIQALNENDEAVLQAPPGAGKTTCVPLALLDLITDGLILVLEPRRLAARAVAERMADNLGERCGQTVGYRVRLDSKQEANTRILVITEGILTRMLQDDPSLEGVACVIFDEFHERSLDADLGLSLCLQARELFRDEPLKLLVMSATLDGEQVAKLLGGAPIISSAGRSYPVAVQYRQTELSTRSSRFDIARAMCTAICDAFAACEGSVLAFFPGQGEIEAALELLRTDPAIGAGAEVLPLYGNLPLTEQRRVLNSSDKRRIVLATNIAETSLTVPGIDAVVDSGLERRARFDPASGMLRLATCRISRASSEQRAGRAGRLGPGRCYRLWSESGQQALAEFTPAEISQADLAPLALQLMQWGVDSPDELAWLDPPPSGSHQQALELLGKLGACRAREGVMQLTERGKKMATLAAHPRLAHMLMVAAEIDQPVLGCELAAILSERDPLRYAASADISLRLSWLGERGGAQQRCRQLAQQFQRQLQPLNIPVAHPVDKKLAPGILLASAYPDRIAQRATALSYRLSGGRRAELEDIDNLKEHRYLACAQLGSSEHRASDRISLAAPLNLDTYLKVCPEVASRVERLHWDDSAERICAEVQICLGKLIIDTKPADAINPESKVALLCQLVRKRGLDVLPWSAGLRQWQWRVRLMRELEPDVWPDLSGKALLAGLEQWLAPYLNKVDRLSDFARLDLRQILTSQLPWPLPQQLDKLAPERFVVPTGSAIQIDYSANPPVLAVRLQEMFGCTETPSIAGGKVKLLLHLLSPAQRPLQVTQDLQGFWAGSYEQIKKDMKGRYPKHHWPDNPLECEPTRRVKHPKTKC